MEQTSELEISITKLSKPYSYRTTLTHIPSNNQYHCDFILELNRLTFSEKLSQIDEMSLQSLKDRHNLAEKFGKELFHTVLQKDVQEKFRRYTENGFARIRLRIEPEELKNIPWEFMHDGKDFISTRTLQPFSQFPLGIDRQTLAQLDGQLRMLIVVSNPLDLEEHMRLDINLEMEALSHALEPLEKENLIETVCCDTASVEAVQDYLMEQDYHILYFTGHGCFAKGKDRKERGFLIMEDSQGKKRPVDNEEFARLIQDRPSLRLVTLSACQSARTSKTESYRDLARSLLKKGVPAVVAMRISIFEHSATLFARTFYRAVACKKGIDIAMAEARNAMFLCDESNRLDFATPILFLNDPHCLDLTQIKPGKPKEIKIEPVMFGNVSVMHRGFVGRHREIRLIRDGFLSDRKRLAIIHGFGGIGKSVLATTVALRMREYFDIIKAIKCSQNTTADGILGEINSALMLAEIHQFNQILNKPEPLQTKIDILLQILTQVKLLLILDNCESILNKKREIAKPDLSVLLNHLLNGLYTNSKVIITTRWEFDPLEGRLQDEIIRISLPEFNFFTARQLMNRYARIEGLPVEKKLKIFKSIGGHPYAYEIFDRHIVQGTIDTLLRDIAPVAQELKAFTLLEKTYEKLSLSAQELLQKLSVFEEPFPAKAVKWMAEEKDISEDLSMIIGWGLIAREQTDQGEQYSLYAMVRNFCRDLLDKNPVLDRKKLLIHAGKYYEEQVKTSKSLWDLLLARDYYFHAGEFDQSAEIVNATTEYLLRWGHISLLMRLLQESAETTEGQCKAVMLGNLATIYQNMGDYKSAIEKHEEVLKIFEKLGDKRNIATALHQLGNVHYLQGDYVSAVEKYQKSLKIEQELGDKSGIAITLHQLGMVHQDQGDYTSAVDKYQESLKIKQELGDKSGIAITLHQLGNVHYLQGDYVSAVDKYQESLKIEQELGDKSGIAKTLHQLGMVHQDQGDYTSAVDKYQESLKIKQELGDKSGIAKTLGQLGMVHEKQGDLTSAMEKLTQARAIFEQIGEKTNLAMVDENLTRLRSKINPDHS